MIGDDKVKDINAAKKNGFLSLQKVHKGVDIEKNIKRTDGYFNSYTDLRIFVKNYWS